jgi:hypothetical protein
MMNRQKAWIWPFCAVLIFCLFLLPARSWAQNDDSNQNQNPVQNNNQNVGQDSVGQDNDQNDDQSNNDQSVDPPSRVAEMNFTQGSVSFQPGGEGDWVDAVPNRPLTTGDNLWTDKESRAELHVGSTSIRLSSETSLTFLELDDHVLQLRLAQGSTLVRVHHFDDDDTVEIDTPNLAFTVQRNGEYRVDVQPDGKTTIVDVYQGRGEALGGGNNYTVVANQQASFSGDQDQALSYDIDALSTPDDFTRWAFDRDHREDQSQSANYVSPEMTGYEDLDDNGQWSYAGSYGPVWYPTSVAVGWAPYRFGHWVWVAPWGWTWVDDARWGFAPFHYGRWAQVGGRWGWIPGPAAVHPVYAPALVAFVGGGRGFQLSASFGGGAGVAWFPLGPGEVFVPAYHVSRAYVNQVNVTNTVVNVTKVTNVYNTYHSTNVANVNGNVNVNRITYVNQTNVTVVSHDTFVNARPVGRNVVAVQPREIANAPIGRMSGVEPVRGSVMGAGKPTTVAPPRTVINRQVVAQHAPVQPPVPFGQRQDKLMVRPVAPVNQQAGRPVAQPTNANPAPAIRQQQMQPMTRTESAPVPPQRPVQAVPQVETPRPPTAQPVRPQQPYNNSYNNNVRNNNGAMNSRSDSEPSSRPSSQPSSQPGAQQGWSHPQARPAPPVQPKSETQARDEETKYKNWQAKPQAAKPPEKPAPPKEDKKK